MKVVETMVQIPLDLEKIRLDFPILHTTVNGKPLVYFDNGATTQKPLAVTRAIETYYNTYNSNVHRGVHTLSQKATIAYEESRTTVAGFINAKPEELIFTKGTTDAINLLAYTFGKQFIKEGDEIIISAMEHHSNIVPWQLCCEDRKAVLKVVPINDKGELEMGEYEKMLSDKTKLVAITYVSNTLGTVNPVKDIIALAHARNIPVMLDAAQAVQHIAIDVKELDVDFMAFSGHKLYGPTGIGALYGKESWLEQLPPYQGGGDMIKTVSFDKTVYADPPLRFEAGTPNIAGAIGMAAGVKYLIGIGLDKIATTERVLTEYALEQLSSIDGLRLIGTAEHRGPTFSFIIGNSHPTDVGELLDMQGIAVRTGHHCTQPLMDLFCIPGTARASLSFYNTPEEIDRLVDGIHKAMKLLKK
ncbi:aminotransferase class V-fold PLP-dependent enzyme [uncultured Chitinophaga sp.]|uniref:aminotransferase class V-fold PLP-dependent enzyme n=1 Tax=uncultured Chitinophaga sp. TaxID=339340 RepID=UPI0025DBBBFD|nr:cysteine desulfurase [uncultured Chitinophaga sp.]